MVDQEMFKPDADASELDRRVMAVAKELHESGDSETANAVATSAAYLRETWGGRSVRDDKSDVYEALLDIRDNAEFIIQVLETKFIDKLAEKYLEVPSPPDQ